MPYQEGSKKVLIGEDDPATISLIRRILAEATVAESVAEAILMLKEHQCGALVVGALGGQWEEVVRLARSEQQGFPANTVALYCADQDFLHQASKMGVQTLTKPTIPINLVKLIERMTSG